MRSGDVQGSGFVGDWGTSQREQHVKVPALRNQIAAIILHRGVSLAGTVKGPDGQPIEGALVVLGDDPYHQSGGQEYPTDRDGNFKLPPLAEKQTNFTVVAEGRAPQMQTIDISGNSKALAFVLDRGKTLA